jgi:hypothetical protein
VSIRYVQTFALAATNVFNETLILSPSSGLSSSQTFSGSDWFVRTMDLPYFVDLSPAGLSDELETDNVWSYIIPIIILSLLVVIGLVKLCYNYSRAAGLTVEDDSKEEEELEEKEKVVDEKWNAGQQQVSRNIDEHQASRFVNEKKEQSDEEVLDSNHYVVDALPRRGFEYDSDSDSEDSMTMEPSGSFGSSWLLDNKLIEYGAGTGPVGMDDYIEYDDNGFLEDVPQSLGYDQRGSDLRGRSRRRRYGA